MRDSARWHLACGRCQHVVNIASMDPARAPHELHSTSSFNVFWRFKLKNPAQNSHITVRYGNFHQSHTSFTPTCRARSANRPRLFSKSPLPTTCQRWRLMKSTSHLLRFEVLPSHRHHPLRPTTHRPPRGPPLPTARPVQELPTLGVAGTPPPRFA